MTEKENPQGLEATGAVDGSNNSTTSQQPANANQPPESYNSLLRDTTRDYIAQLDPDNWPDAEMFERGLMHEILSAVLLRNSTAPKENRWRVPREMEPPMVAMALLAREHYTRIDYSDGEEKDVSMFPLHYYNRETGLYEECDDSTLGRYVRAYKFTATPDFIKGVKAVLSEEAPIRQRTRDANLDVVRNGIRDRRSKELLPFSPEYVFTTKTAVDWVDNPPLPVCVSEDGWEWNIEDAIQEMAGGDPEVAELLWDMCMAELRPNVRWDESFWLYSKTGNNGKGTLCQLMRNLLGAGNYTSIPFADFNNEHFMLGALPRVQAVIVDENQVGKYADDNAEFKAAVTNDVFRIDRKHKTPIAARFYGLIVQCVNEIPKIRDRSDSFWRRCITIKFETCFTGRERPEVKHDFIARKEVLEYVQWRALSKEADTIEVPEKCERLMEEFKTISNPVRDFFFDVVPHIGWQLVPDTFCYDLYCAWYAKRVKSGKPMAASKFYDEIGAFFEDLGCEPRDRNKKYSSEYMVGPEPLIVEYGLEDWLPTYRGFDEARKATPDNLKDRYRGWLFPNGNPLAGGPDA